MSGVNLDGEVILDARRVIVDAHHHLWVQPPVPQFDPYDGEAVLADQRCGHNVVASIYVEAQSHYRPDGPQHLRPVGETEYIDDFAEQASRLEGPGSGACAGIVAHADLLLGEAVEDVLNAHREASSRRFVGIRHRTPFDPDVPGHSGPTSGLLSNGRFRAGFSRLAPAGLVFDAMVLQPQIPEVAALARAFEDTTIVLNHLGGPIGVGRFAARRDEAFSEWRDSMRDLAKCPNVYVKLGGLNMDFTGLAHQDSSRTPKAEELAARQKDHVLTAIDLFGPDRCMFESNFPVDKLNVSYVTVWNIFKIMARDFSDHEKDLLFSVTAITAYGGSGSGTLFADYFGGNTIFN